MVSLEPLGRESAGIGEVVSRQSKRATTGDLILILQCAGLILICQYADLFILVCD
jgi:hypothetical protein